METGKQGCVEPAAGPLVEARPTANEKTLSSKETSPMTLARVGHPAPDFEANVYVQGGFQTLKLSDYRGKWIVLCFYPGDFTFV